MPHVVISMLNIRIRDVKSIEFHNDHVRYTWHQLPRPVKSKFELSGFINITSCTHNQSVKETEAVTMHKIHQTGWLPIKPRGGLDLSIGGVPLIPSIQRGNSQACSIAPDFERKIFCGVASRLSMTDRSWLNVRTSSTSSYQMCWNSTSWTYFRETLSRCCELHLAMRLRTKDDLGSP